MLFEVLLQDVQRVWVAESFDGGDLCAVGLRHKNGAGFNGLAVHRDRAGPTMGGFTAHVWTRDVEFFAQRVDQQFAWLSEEFVIFAVDVKFDVHLG